MIQACRPLRLRWSPKIAHGSARIARGATGATLSRRSYATVGGDAKDPAELGNVTRLSNGVRVATEALPGNFSAVGVYVDAGSRYETPALRGVSHIIDRLAFKSTSSRTGDEMLESLESLGGNLQCASSREALMYQSATFNDAVPTAVGLLAETIRDPLITEQEVEEQLLTAEYENTEIWSKPELILPELIHVAAYKENTLGNPLLCPKERLSEITKSTVDAYRQVFYLPERLVIAFAGVDHASALKLTEQYFGDMAAPTSNIQVAAGAPPPASTVQPPQDQSRLLNKIPFLKNLSTSASHSAQHAPMPVSALDTLTLPAHYTGGFLSLPSIPIPANPAMPRLSYIHLAFEALPISSDDIYALATLQTLLGGGGSFSAGGPGKGMYSRLYTNVLNQYPWVESCIAFNHSYSDSGLFGISSSCSPARVDQMLEVMCRELHALSLDTGFSRLQDAEVNRAKNQLRSSLLMNLESRMVELEDLGRQVQTHGYKVPVTEMCAKIDALTIADLRRVAKAVFSGNVQNVGRGSGAPTIVLQEGEEEGRVLKPFQWNDIQQRIARWGLGRR